MTMEDWAKHLDGILTSTGENKMAKRITKTYDQEFKSQAVKLAQEIGGHKAADELGVPSGTIYAWVKAFKEGRLES